MKNFTETLIDYLPDCIIITDGLGNINFINNKAAGLLGYNKEKTGAQKINFLDFLAPEDRGRAKLDMQRALQKGNPVHSEYLVKRETGEFFWVSLDICPIIFDSKKPSFLLIVKYSAGSYSRAVLRGGFPAGEQEKPEEAPRHDAEHQQANGDFYYELQFQRLLADISASFTYVTAEKLDEAIDRILEISGKFFNLDRSYLFQFSADGEIMDNTHEWCAEGIEPQIDNLKGLSSGAFPWWMKKLNRFNCINVPSVEDLPPQADAEKNILQAQDIQSVLVVPVVSMNRLVGFIGFDSVRKKKIWAEEEISLLKIVAEVISSALAKCRAEEALRKAYRQQYKIVEHLPDATFVIDQEGKVIAWNKAMEKITGIPKEKMIGRGDYEYSIPFYGERRPILINLALAPDSEVTARFERKYNSIRREGDELIAEAYAPKAYGGRGAYLWGSASRLRDDSGNVVGAIESIRDTTDRKRYEEQLKYLSLHDPLTGLYNRAFFEKEMQRLNESREFPITIVSADIDDLKLVNDTLGHDAGDEMLKACASVLKHSLRKSDILARIGGDEFAAILPRTGEKTGEEIAGRIHSYVALYNSERPGLHLSISVGTATAKTGDVSLMETLKKSDHLMYREKLYRKPKSQLVDTLLAALAEKDYIAENHAQRISDLCLKLGKRMGLSSRQLNKLALLAQVHDLGKVGIPDAILFKRGPLSDKEWEIMRQHPEKGYRIAIHSPDLSEVADLILKHHERWDGKGYPLGLKGEEIPVECRVLAIADAFDTMTSDRPYREAKTREEAIQELKKCAGTQFDPKLTDMFVSLLEELEQYHPEEKVIG